MAPQGRLYVVRVTRKGFPERSFTFTVLGVSAEDVLNWWKHQQEVGVKNVNLKTHEWGLEVKDGPVPIGSCSLMDADCITKGYEAVHHAHWSTPRH